MPISIPAFLSYLLLIGPARAQVSAPNCTNSTFAWVGSLRSDASFVSMTTRFLHCAGVFIVVSIHSNKIPAGSPRTWRRRVTTAVSRCTFGTPHTILSACAVFSVPTLPQGRSYAGPTDTEKGDICQCNTVVYNLLSACDACQGESWFPCVDQLCFRLVSNQSTYLFNQLLYVVVQLHNQSDSRDVSPVSFLIAIMLNLPPQLPEPGPGWHASTKVGLLRHICCAFLPYAFACLPKKSHPYRSVTSGTSLWRNS